MTFLLSFVFYLITLPSPASICMMLESDIILNDSKLLNTGAIGVWAVFSYRHKKVLYYNFFTMSMCFFRKVLYLFSKDTLSLQESIHMRQPCVRPSFCPLHLIYSLFLKALSSPYQPSIKNPQ